MSIDFEGIIPVTTHAGLTKSLVPLCLDGDFFDLGVLFERAEPEPVGPIDREKMKEKPQ